jgi:hypothetical protein
VVHARKRAATCVSSSTPNAAPATANVAAKCGGA